MTSSGTSWSPNCLFIYWHLGQSLPPGHVQLTVLLRRKQDTCMDNPRTVHHPLGGVRSLTSGVRDSWFGATSVVSGKMGKTGRS